MWHCISGCSDRPLSRAGAETFLKYVYSGNTYVYDELFSIASAAICDSMRRLIANQWWGTENVKKKIH
jgi:hypothetical protein